MKIAVIESGKIARFREGGSAKAGELPVVDVKPDIVGDFQLDGPAYKVERDRVIATYTAIPVDGVTRLERVVADLVKRVADLEGR